MSHEELGRPRLYVFFFFLGNDFSYIYTFYERARNAEQGKAPAAANDHQHFALPQLEIDASEDLHRPKGFPEASQGQEDVAPPRIPRHLCQVRRPARPRTSTCLQTSAR